MDESFKAWSQGKVDEQLLRALNVKITCKEKCPSKLWAAISWKQHGSDLEIVFLAPTVDVNEEVIEADPFILYDGGSCQMRYTGDIKLTVDKTKKDCMLFEAKTLEDNLATSGEQRCLNDTHTPWNSIECGLSRPQPQVKGVGLSNVIYCEDTVLLLSR